MNDEQRTETKLVGRRYLVYTPTTYPYKGTLVSATEKEFFFEGKDGKIKCVPRGMYDMEEERNQ